MSTPPVMAAATPSNDSPLDTAAYPHLLDLVLSHAPHASLLRFRAVSRALRTRADALLNADRLIFTAADLRPSTTVEAVEVPADHGTRVIVSSPAGRIPAFAAWALEPPSILEADLSLTRVIDFQGPAVTGPIKHLLRERNAPPLTLRVIPDKYTNRDIYNPPPDRGRALKPSDVECGQLLVPAAEALVRFTSLAQLIRHQLKPVPHLLGAEQRPSRAVLTISFHPDDQRRGLYPWQPKFSLPPARETVCIFRRAPRPKIYSDLGRPFSPSEWDRGVLRDSRVMDYMRLVIRSLTYPLVHGGIERVVLVDADALDFAWMPRAPLDHPRGVVFALCEGDIKDHLTFAGAGEAWHARLEDMLGRIATMSLDEYRASVGPERAALETSEEGML